MDLLGASALAALARLAAAARMCRAGQPTFLQRERWQAVQRAKLRGLSIRGMARELGIHRNTVRKYIDAESPPTRRSPVASTEAASDTIPEPTGDISPEQLNGHSP